MTEASELFIYIQAIMCDAAGALIPAAVGALSSATVYTMLCGVTEWSLLGCNQRRQPCRVHQPVDLYSCIDQVVVHAVMQNV